MVIPSRQNSKAFSRSAAREGIEARVEELAKCPRKDGIRESALVIFEDCSHAPIYENVAEFNGKTLAFLQRHVG